MLTLRPAAATRATARDRRPVHVHWFRWAAHDPFGPGGLYACRCGVVRHGF